MLTDLKALLLETVPVLKCRPEMTTANTLQRTALQTLQPKLV